MQQERNVTQTVSYSLLLSAADGAGSIAASVRLEQALSDEAASTSIKLSVPAVLALQAKLWLAIGTYRLLLQLLILK